MKSDPHCENVADWLKTFEIHGLNVALERKGVRAYSFLGLDFGVLWCFLLVCLAWLWPSGDGCLSPKP